MISSFGSPARGVVGPGLHTPLFKGSDIVFNITLGDPFSDHGVRQLAEVAQRTREHAGDGSKTAIVLCHTLFRFGREAIASAGRVNEVLAGMETAVEMAKSSLTKQAHPIADEQLRHVASTAAKNEHHGDLVAQAIKKAGEDGEISIDARIGSESSYLNPIKGLHFDRGYLSPEFINQPESGECRLSDAAVLLYDRPLRSVVLGNSIRGQFCRSRD